jgi:2-methylcitrate dehydratase PrpD
VTASARLAEFVTSLRLEDLPAGVREAAKLHALDTLGCGLAAHGLGEGTFVHAAAAEVATAGPATAIGRPGGLPAGEAALLNGTLCHLLDFDDTHPDSVVHVSAAVVPAALAAAETSGAVSGAELLCALVAGNEISVRLGMAAGGRFHARGFHPTGVCGVFGATATVAKLRGLSEEQTINALGIAGSMAGGLLEFLADGAKTKPLHPGFAAQAALTAVRLAAHGASGPRSVLDGERGFFAAYLNGEETNLAEQVADLGTRYETPRIAFKPYPACHYVHAPVDSLAMLIEREGLTADDVESITAFSDATGVALVLEPAADKVRPRTVYDAKFSLPFCLASLLVHGSVDVTTFAEAAIAESAVLELAMRVRGEVRAYALSPDAFPGGVRVHTRDGRTLEHELRHQRGGSEFPMSTDDIVAKYRFNAGQALTGAAAAGLEEAVLGLDGLRSLTTFGVLSGALVAADALV